MHVDVYSQVNLKNTISNLQCQLNTFTQRREELGITYLIYYSASLDSKNIGYIQSSILPLGLLLLHYIVCIELPDDLLSII